MIIFKLHKLKIIPSNSFSVKMLVKYSIDNKILIPIYSYDNSHKHNCNCNCKN